MARQTTDSSWTANWTEMSTARGAAEMVEMVTCMQTDASRWCGRLGVGRCREQQLTSTQTGKSIQAGVAAAAAASGCLQARTGYEDRLVVEVAGLVAAKYEGWPASKFFFLFRNKDRIGFVKKVQIFQPL